MQHLSNIFHIPAILLLILLSSCSNKENVIPHKAMVNIIGDMYLADQYIEERPEFRAQMDSLLLYEAVAQRHGYTFDDYHTSIAYYLEQGDELKKMYLRARKNIMKKRDELEKINQQANVEVAEREVTWMEDSLAGKHINNLWKEPYLRNHKWLSGTQAESRWRPTDSTAYDIPANAIWWKNTVDANIGRPAADTLYPVLQREYLIWKDNKPEVVKRKRPAPDMNRINRQNMLDKQAKENKETKETKEVKQNKQNKKARR